MSSGMVHHDVRGVAEMLLDRAAGEHVEVLIVGADLHVALERVGVIPLHQRVERLVEAQRLAALHALLEVAPGDDLLHREDARQIDQVGERELRQPLAVVADLGALGIEHAIGLVGVGLRELQHLVVREALAASLACPLGSPIVAV